MPHPPLTLDEAERLCAARGVRLTPVRRRVLALLLASDRALGAYEILEVLRAEGLGAQPPAAYRALDFLVAQGFVHKIERIDAFVACTHPDEGHSPAFLICTDCAVVVETLPDPHVSELERAAREAGFAIGHAVREAEGVCADFGRVRAQA